MSRGAWAVITISVVFFTSAWIYLDLHTKQVVRQSSKLHAVLDEVERDLDTYDSVNARSQSAYTRAQKVAQNMRDVADAQRKLMDSLSEAAVRDAQEDIGYGSYPGSEEDSESNFNDDSKDSEYLSKR